MYNNKLLPFDQLLIDIHPKTHKLIDWRGKKLKAERLAQSLKRLHDMGEEYEKKAYRVHECGNWLQFKVYPQTNEKTLNRANFCRYRLCPICAWRRSMKIFSQTTLVMNEAEKEGYRFIFVTLTVRNIFGHDLANAITDLFNSYERLMDRKHYKRVIFGGMRCLEVTHNVDRTDKWFDSYHPHIHAIWAVKPSYFKKRENFIDKSQLIRDWAKSAKLDYDPSVDIAAVKKRDNAIKEVSKYATKSGDYLVDDPDLTDAAVWHLDTALENRRLISYTGILRKIKTKLQLDDAETGDLINVEAVPEIREDLNFIIQNYSWHAGYRQYTKAQNPG